MTTRKSLIFLSLCFCMTFLSCSLFKKVDDGGMGNKPNIPNEDTRYVGVESVFDIQFMQDGIEAPIEEGIVKLKKVPFSIFVNMQGVDGVYLNASTAYDEKYQDDNTFDEFDNIYPKIMAEPAFNQDRELFLSRDNYSYWFYDQNLDWHRLSDVQVRGDQVIGEKVVQNFFFPDASQRIAVTGIADDLFLFFFAVEDKLEDGFQLRQRQYIKLEWTN